MFLLGQGLEEWSVLNKEIVYSNYWLWHINFFHVPEVPEFLIAGKEREFWGKWMRDECYDPSAISDDLVDEIVRGCSSAGGLRPIFDVYRATFENIDFVNKKMKEKLTMPVNSIGSIHFIGEEVHREAKLFAENVTCEFLDCGHSLALERPKQLAEMLHKFMG
jgi:hypothetical protein